MYRPQQLEDIFKLMDKLQDKNIGIELFTEWQDEKFIALLEGKLDKLKDYNSTLHGPYYNTEHSKEKGTAEYEIANKYFLKTLRLSQQLKSKYIVYHFNNCKITPENRKDMVRCTKENLKELSVLACSYEANIVVENTGTVFNNNQLFNEAQFIEVGEKLENNILIDIGHAFINGWNMENVISCLKDKIVAYHLHNNYGVIDSHNRINDGKININDFFKLYKEYTPKADLVIEYSKECGENSEGIEEDVQFLKNV